MAFREVSDLSSDTTIALGGTDKKTGKLNPSKLEGYYLGSRQVSQKKGVATLHFFQTPKGNIGLWGKTDSNRKLGAVTPGTMTKIEFDRMVPTPNGDMYKYKVSVDEDNTIQVAVNNVSATADNNDGGGYSDSGDAYSDSDDEQNEDEVQAAALAAAERKAKVQALLSKKSKVG